MEMGSGTLAAISLHPSFSFLPSRYPTCEAKAAIPPLLTLLLPLPCHTGEGAAAQENLCMYVLCVLVVNVCVFGKLRRKVRKNEFDRRKKLRENGGDSHIDTPPSLQPSPPHLSKSKSYISSLPGRR